MERLLGIFEVRWEVESQLANPYMHHSKVGMSLPLPSPLPLPFPQTTFVSRPTDCLIGRVQTVCLSIRIGCLLFLLALSAGFFSICRRLHVVALVVSV